MDFRRFNGESPFAVVSGADPHGCHANGEGKCVIANQSADWCGNPIPYSETDLQDVRTRPDAGAAGSAITGKPADSSGVCAGSERVCVRENTSKRLQKTWLSKDKVL